MECGLLLGVKGAKHTLFCGSECVLYLGQSARSCRREAHRVAAPVLRGASGGNSSGWHTRALRTRSALAELPREM